MNSYIPDRNRRRPFLAFAPWRVVALLRELSRFAIEDSDGTPHEVVEVVVCRVLSDGREEPVTIPTMLTTAGLEVFPAGLSGEYRIPRIGASARRQ
jgi:hypothetical protein